MFILEKKTKVEEAKKEHSIKQQVSLEENTKIKEHDLNSNSNENKELVDFELSEENDSDHYPEEDWRKSAKSSSSDIDIRNNSNPNDDADDSIQSDESKVQIKLPKPNLFIKIEEELSSKTDSSKANASDNNKLSYQDHDLTVEEVRWSPNHIQIESNRFKKLNEELSKISYQKDLEHLIASPKEESILTKYRYLKFITEEIKIIENSDEEDEPKEFAFSKYNKSGSIQLKIEDDSERVWDDNSGDDLDSFRKEHNRIVHDDPELINSEVNKSNSFETYNKEYDKQAEYQNLRSENKKSLLSSSFDDKYSLSISSINDEINHKEKAKDGLWTGKPQIDQLFEDDSSIKEWAKDGTLTSEEILTYSLSNTLKTVD